MDYPQFDNEPIDNDPNGMIIMIRMEVTEVILFYLIQKQVS